MSAFKQSPVLPDLEPDMTTREQWLNDFAAAARPQFEAAGAPLPENVRVSVGFPSTGRKGKRIGECWSDTCSEDGRFEIFIHPTLAVSERVADVLTHELIHAAVGLAAGHGPAFRKVAVALGLTGKMTATVAGPAWTAWAAPVLETLGPIPHGSLRSGGNGEKKQTTRMIKVVCNTCKFTFRTTAKWIEGRDLVCPDRDCDGEMGA
jgi:hypothetical protein